jgi:signal transduction histidine kinase/DNA-binding NarL/FixJ family response regulator
MRNLSFAFLVVMVTASVGSALFTRGVEQHQERGLLRERASEVSLVLASLTSTVQAKLNVVATAARSSNLSPQSFTDAASAGDPNVVGVALLRPAPDGFVAELAAGPRMVVGQIFTGVRADAMRRALTVPVLVGTPVMSEGGLLTIGFALGAPSAPRGSVVYREAVIHPGTPTRTTTSAPFSELVVSLYASPHADATQLLLTSGHPGQSTAAPGTLHRQFAVGDSQWLLTVAARKPLVGSLVARSPFIVLVMGLLVSVAVFAVIEATVRRRDYALGLVDARTAELQDSLRSLKAAELEAQQASHLKSQFLANMSHEIRTPMNGVLGMTQLVLTGNLDPDQRRRMLTLHATGQSLLNIINDILDFSKMEAGRLELENEAFDLYAVVGGAVSLMASPANDKGLVLSLTMDPDAPQWVVGDSGRLRQVLINLIGNAVKFTEHGSVTVTVSHLPSGRLRFAVRDTGVGIDLSFKAHLLEPFSQADASTTRVFGGTGLGLAICRQLVDLMDGTFDFTSEPGTETMFWFDIDLPAAEAPASGAASSLTGGRTFGDSRRAMAPVLADGPTLAMSAEPVAEPLSEPPVELAAEAPATGVLQAAGVSGVSDASGTSGTSGTSGGARGSTDGDSLPGMTPVSVPERGRRILLVDDAEMNRLVGKGLLECIGYQVDCVGSGAEALEAVGPGGYAAILMDCLMPVMDGYEATRRIRQLDGPARHTPIIALTAAAMNGDRERCIAAGMDDYVSKPIDLEVLTSVLAQFQPAETGTPPAARPRWPQAPREPQAPRALPAPHEPQAPREPQAPPEPQGPPASTAAEDDAETVLRDRLDLIARRLPADAFGRICREFLSATPDLIVELGTAVRAGDSTNTTVLAHKLKGGMLTIGAVQLSSLAQRIEVGDGSRGAILDEIDIEYRKVRDVVASLVPQGVNA